MIAFDNDPDIRWLFAMTHPDDEISICAWIRRLTSNGADVWMSWTHSNEVREAEARRVAEMLGVRQDRLAFFGATDGGVCFELGRLLPQFQETFAAIEPDRIACGAFEQGHLDHDATNWLVNQSFDGPVFEIPLYHTYLTRFPRINRFADPLGEEILELSNDEARFKKLIAKQYPSQAIWKNLLFAELRSKLVGDGSLRATERMRLQTHKDFRVVNVPGLKGERVEESSKWERWLQSLAATRLVTKEHGITAPARSELTDELVEAIQRALAKNRLLTLISLTGSITEHCSSHEKLIRMRDRVLEEMRCVIEAKKGGEMVDSTPAYRECKTPLFREGKRMSAAIRLIGKAHTSSRIGVFEILEALRTCLRYDGISQDAISLACQKVQDYQATEPQGCLSTLGTISKKIFRRRKPPN